MHSIRDDNGRIIGYFGNALGEIYAMICESIRQKKLGKTEKEEIYRLVGLILEAEKTGNQKAQSYYTSKFETEFPDMLFEKAIDVYWEYGRDREEREEIDSLVRDILTAEEAGDTVRCETCKRIFIEKHPKENLENSLKKARQDQHMKNRFKLIERIDEARKSKDDAMRGTLEEEFLARYPDEDVDKAIEKRKKKLTQAKRSLIERIIEAQEADDPKMYDAYVREFADQYPDEDLQRAVDKYQRRHK